MSNITPKNVKKPRRIKNFFLTSQTKKHAAKLGEIMLAWNLLQFSFYLLFEDYISSVSRTSAKNMWDSINSDTGQRKLLMALLEDLERPEKGDVLWAIKQANTLSEFRNSYAHVAMMGDNKNKTTIAMYGNRKSYVDNLKIIEQKNLFIPLRNDICRLQDYVMSISYVIFHSKTPTALPPRPKLEVLEAFGRNKSQNTRYQKTSMFDALYKASGQKSQ